MLTWSLGCTVSPAMSVATWAITSLTFMLLLVPDPVWKTSTGKCASSPPAQMRSAAARIASAISGSSSPSSLLTWAQARLISAMARMIGTGMAMPLMGKLSTARCVWAP